MKNLFSKEALHSDQSGWAVSRKVLNAATPQGCCAQGIMPGVLNQHPQSQRFPVVSSRNWTVYLRVTNRIILIFFGFLFFFGIFSNAQTQITEVLFDIESQTEAAVTEILESMKENPIDLNHASRSRLESCPLITANLAERIIRERSKKMFSSYDVFIRRLRLSRDVWNELSPFFRIGPLPEWKDRLSIRIRHGIDTPEEQGFITSAYTGNRSKLVQRIRYCPSARFRAGLLVEKDAGEPRWNDHQVGFIESKWLNGKANTILGHYSVEAGQGLVLWGPYRFSHGPDPIVPLKSHETRSRGYTYSDEASPLFGLLTRIQTGRLTGQVFVSRVRRDARLNTAARITSFPASGQHRTESELDSRHRVEESISGAVFEIALPTGRVGMTGYRMFLSVPEEKRPELPGAVGGVHYVFRVHSLTISGESAWTDRGGRALILNQCLQSDRVSFMASVRDYSPSFVNSHGNGFTAKGGINERGVYLGFKINLQKGKRFRCWFDLYKRPKHTAILPTPTAGSACYGELSFFFKPGHSLVFRYKQSSEPFKRSGFTQTGRAVTLLQQRSQQQLRLEMRCGIHDEVTLRSRIQWSLVFTPPLTGEINCPPLRHNGLLLFQDIRWQKNPRWLFAARCTYFDTDSWDSRIYMSETGIPGLFSIPVLYGKGMRQSLMFRIRPFAWLDLVSSFSVTYRDRVSSWGSGYNRTEGDSEKRCTIQVDMRF